jgi:hypothetical protein
MGRRTIRSLASIGALVAGSVFYVAGSSSPTNDDEDARVDERTRVTRRPLVWSPPPWYPPGFERLNRLLAEGHVYKSMAWP